MIVVYYCLAELGPIPSSFMNWGLVFISEGTYVNKKIVSQIHIYVFIYYKNNTKLFCI